VEKISDKDLLIQFEKILERYSGEKFVKIFNSGSFFDDSEISPRVRKKILTKLYKTTDKISVESRPEYITNEKMLETKNTVGEKTFEIGIGLETANDFVREHAINKGFSIKDYNKAVQTLKKQKFKLKTYVLIKPPFLTEKQSINDSINTIKKIQSTPDIISFNPTNVQRHSVVDYLWKRKQYRPAWLWSVVEILKQSKKLSNSLIKCDIAGGGNIRGAHNCKNCDRKFINAIADFSLNQNIKIFEELDCDCKEKWLDQLEIEDLTFGSKINFSGGFR